MNKSVITVSQLNLFVKSLLDADVRLADLYISGEISNYSGHYRSGHLYFSLKDENASVKAVMFSRSAAKLRFEPENGMRVLVRGRVSVYERDGVYQIYAEEIQPDGAGALAVAFEQLKKRLSAQGLFDGAHKRSLPAFPRRIGVVTSPTGAAIHDILNILARRWPLCTVVFCPVSVQGGQAAGEITEAIHALNAHAACDVILVGRGGGSAEDLWAFNDETLARAVYASQIPVVSAVGHESDFTICDFVSDLRAPTPSAAAELVTPDKGELNRRVRLLQNHLRMLLREKIDSEQERYRQLLFARNFTSPARFFDGEKQTLDILTTRLTHSYSQRLLREQTAFSAKATRLDSLSPLKVLARGYAVVSEKGQVLTSVAAIRAGDRLHIRMHDGEVSCTTDNVRLHPEREEKHV